MPLPDNNIRDWYVEVRLVLKFLNDVMKEGDETLTCQTSGRPVYTCRMVCRSDSEPGKWVLWLVVWIVGDGACVGNVLGSKGS